MLYYIHQPCNNTNSTIYSQFNNTCGDKRVYPSFTLSIHQHIGNIARSAFLTYLLHLLNGTGDHESLSKKMPKLWDFFGVAGWNYKKGKEEKEEKKEKRGEGREGRRERRRRGRGLDTIKI